MWKNERGIATILILKVVSAALAVAAITFAVNRFLESYVEQGRREAAAVYKAQFDKFAKEVRESVRRIEESSQQAAKDAQARTEETQAALKTISSKINLQRGANIVVAPSGKAELSREYVSRQVEMVKAANAKKGAAK